jgi:hypothetical protein
MFEVILYFHEYVLFYKFQFTSCLRITIADYQRKLYYHPTQIMESLVLLWALKIDLCVKFIVRIGKMHSKMLKIFTNSSSRATSRNQRSDVGPYREQDVSHPHFTPRLFNIRLNIVT